MSDAPVEDAQHVSEAATAADALDEQHLPNRSPSPSSSSSSSSSAESRPSSSSAGRGAVPEAPVVAAPVLLPSAPLAQLSHAASTEAKQQHASAAHADLSHDDLAFGDDNYDTDALSHLHLQQVEPVTIDWRALSVSVQVSRKETKEILHRVAGHVQPGEMLAIMGSTGAGKTSLLQALSQRSEGAVSGYIDVNGKPLRGKLRHMGYVSQDDYLFPMLTVRETLETSAKLRLPAGTTPEERTQRVDAVIEQLGLQSCQHSRVGDAMNRGISGGERRRVVIGEVLVANPSVLFLDEPTSGLDATTALAVVETLRALARAGRTIICTIHQPRSAVYAHFDKLMLLAEGHVVYFGAAADAVSYFESLKPVPMHCPEFSNPADFFLDLTTMVGREDRELAQRRVKYLIESYKKTDEYRRGQLADAEHGPASIERLALHPPVHSERHPCCGIGAYPTGWCSQFATLTQRGFRNYVRRPLSGIVSLVQNIVLGVIIGLIFLQLPLDQTAAQNRAGVVFFITMFQTFNNLALVINTFPLEKPVVLKERAASAYHISAYFMSKMISELLFQLLTPIVFIVIAYWMTGLNASADRFFIFVGLELMVAFSASGFALFVSAAAPNVQIVQIVGPISVVMFMLFAGFFVNEETIPVWLSWIRYLSFIRYGFRGGLVNELTGATFTCANGAACNPTAISNLFLCAGTTTPCNPSGTLALQLFNLQNVVVGHEIAIMTSFVVGFRILAYIMLRCVARPAFKGRTLQAPAEVRESDTAQAVAAVDAALAESVVFSPEDSKQVPATGAADGTAAVAGAAAATATSSSSSSSLADAGAAKPENMRVTRSALELGAIRPVELQWRNVDLSVVVQRGVCGKIKVEKPILRGCSGIVRPGEVLAIMGATGAGKSSLLNVLAQRAMGNIVGDIMVNGVPVSDRIKDLGYVPQDDNLFATLTVRETIEFAARMRLPADMSYEQKMKRVDEVIDELGLGKAANTRVGNALRRGISGGERRRVSIAEVLVTNPSLLFLDEPTSGLDSATSLSVVETLRALAQRGRTVVCTIHQPRSNIFSQFDKLMLLAKGQVVYFGPAASAVSYFGGLQPVAFKCPEHSNPADYFLDLTTAVSNVDKARAEKRVAYLVSSYDVPMSAPSTQARLDQYRDHVDVARASCGMQFFLLLQRAWRIKLRDPMSTVIRLIQAIFIALLLGCIFLQLGYTQQNVRDRQGILFFLMMFQSFSGLGAVLESFQGDKVVFRRERSNGMYRVSAFIGGKMLAELIYDIVLPILFTCIAYFMIGLNPAADRFFIFLGINILVALTGTSLGYFISSISPNITVAGILAPIILTMFSLFGGFYNNASTLPVYFIWLEYISFIKYGFAALTVNEFAGATFTCAGAPICQYTTGQQVLDALGNGTWEVWKSAVILIAMTIIWRIITYLLLRFVVKSRFSKPVPRSSVTSGAGSSAADAKTSASKTSA